MYDLVLKNGLVIDPKQEIHGTLDVAITGDKIAALDHDIDRSKAKRVINVIGKIVTPGLIDAHVHCYHNMLETGVKPDRAGVYSGPTTVVSAGDAGPVTLYGFRKYIVEPAISNVYCLLNVAIPGMAFNPPPDQKLNERWSELSHWNDIDPELTLRKIDENRDIVVGIKLRAFGPLIESDGIKPIELAKKIAVDAGLPIVVHIGAMQGNVPSGLNIEILKLLDKGDILSHVYTARPGGVIEPNKPIMNELTEARERGVLFEIAHGWFNFGFEVARYGLQQGIAPDIIASDLAIPNVFGPVYSLCETMSKMMVLGLSLEQVIRMTTVNPAKALHMEDRHGSLEVGRAADVSVLQLIKGKHIFLDSYGDTLEGDLVLLPVFTVKSGKEVV